MPHCNWFDLDRIASWGFIHTTKLGRPRHVPLSVGHLFMPMVSASPAAQVQLIQ